MNYENTQMLNEVKHALIEWAEAGEEAEAYPPCLMNWRLNEDQLVAIKEACAVPYAAASIAHAMWCITDEEGLATIAKVLRHH